MSELVSQKKGFTRDMTIGSPLQHMLIFAIPLFIGNVFQQAYTLVDTMVAGYTLGDSAIAAIGATSFMTALIISSANGLNSGFAIVVTQCFGAGDMKRMRMAIAGQIKLNLLVDVGLTAIILAFLHPYLSFMNVPDSIYDDAYTYVFIIFAGMVGTIAYNMFSSILRAVGNSRAPLIFLIICSVLHVIIVILFVSVFHWGIAGAALATIISQTVSAILSGLYVFRTYRDILPTKEDWKVPVVLLKELLGTGISMALMMTVVDIGSIFYQRANNGLGEVYITAHSAAYKYAGILMQPFGSLTTACSTFVSQNWGARKPERIKKALRISFYAELIWSAFSILIAFTLAGPLLQFMTNTSNPDVITYGILSMCCHVAMFPFLGLLMPLRASLQSMTQKVAPLLSSCIELVMKIISSFFVIPVVGYLGTCLTEPVTWVLMAIFLAGFYLIRKKKLYAPIEEAAAPEKSTLTEELPPQE